jgi:mono/diheme cytochrome c family protein
VRGITPVGVSSDATFVESRLSWYPSEHAYLLTPGATRNDPRTAIESLGRRLSLEDVQQCFSCHTTDYTPSPSGPVLNEMGIHCERCHGPGLDHVRLMTGPAPPASGQDRNILNPARLKAFAQLEMCGACHGKPPRATDLSALLLIEQTPQTARFPSRRLVLSRCFSESADGLKCTSCHNPHINVSEWRAQRDQPCIACHSERLGAKPRTCPVQQTDCVSCHMPKERAMLHFDFTDHWIRVAWVKAPKSPK